MSDTTGSPCAAPNEQAAAVYLLSCALNEIAPSAQALEGLGHGEQGDALLAFCRDHQISAACAVALKAAGGLDAAWEHALAFAEYKLALQSAERDAVLAELERRRIRHMPLKGSVLGGLYPSPLMREMSDCDILFDNTRADEVDEVMHGRGYALMQDTLNVRCYWREPFLNFEMHYRLFGQDSHPDLVRYYDDVWSLAIPDDGRGSRCHLSPTDFYVYVTLHAFKHYTKAGFGLRTLADEAVMLRTLDGVDQVRAGSILRRFDADGFEATLRGLSGKLFDPDLLREDGRPLRDAVAGTSEQLEPRERGMLAHVLASGSYGTLEQSVQRAFQSQAGLDVSDEAVHASLAERTGYVLRRIFPPLRQLQIGYPVLRHPAGLLLLPGVFVYRLVRGVTTRRGHTATELRELRRIGG